MNITAFGDMPVSATTMASSGIVSREAMRLFQWICFVTCEVVVMFGLGTNIINIICFVKQDFKDPVNVSLLGLAVSDLGSLVTVFYTCLSVIPAYQEADLPFITIDFQYLVSGMPHVAFTRVTSCITAFITLERCLCITMPLKVHKIITTKRVTIIIVSIFLTLTASVAPVYYANRLGTKFSQERNKTLLGLVFTPDRMQVEQYSYAINNVLVPFAAFVVIIISTTILVLKLRKQALWRSTSAAGTNADGFTDRDQRVAKMVVMISALFIACFVPSGIVFVAMLIEPELNMGGKYSNLLVVTHGIGLLLESTNSSMNIFIYYHMSSKYRSLFRRLFIAERKTGKK